MNKALNNYSYAALHWLGDVSRLNVGCGETFRGMTHGSQLHFL